MVNIRPEKAGDEDAIYRLTLAAFEPMFFSDGSEAPLIGELRADGDLTLSLIAEINGEIVGHIAFSPVTIDGRHDDWFGLGPVSVSPDLQGQGIGRALVEKGLQLLRARGAKGCALTGNPDIYRRMGFESDGNLRYGSLDTAFVQRMVFSGQPPSGELKFAPAFGDEYPAE
ncbi:MAG: N-acetyltransferase [Parvibaculum sp.]